MPRPSVFAWNAAARPLWPREFMAEIGIRSPRTLDSYRKHAAFPQGQIERVGRVQVRTFSVQDVVTAQAWLASRGLPGKRANQPRIANLDRARTARAELGDLERLAGKFVRVRGVEALANTLRPLGVDSLGAIPLGHRAAVRAALVRALQPHL